MVIRASFLVPLTGFLCLLAPGTPWPAGAGPRLPPPDPLEFAAVPPSLDDVGRPDPSPEPRIDDNGSEPASAESHAVLDFDPWADAFAESSRLQAVGPQIVDVPAYAVVLNHQVQFFLDRFTSTRRDVVGLWLRRSGRYLGMIRDVLKARGLPEDLAFTAMIESGFDPLAVSRAGAKGLWQFMATTARRYGLRVDHWVDERYDPEKSTVAAAAYLRDLHAQFGSWELAQAGYNAGEVAVGRAMRATGSADFWALTRTRLLRRETKEFVPAIHAAMVIGRDPDQYGFEVGGATTPDVERVAVPPSTELRKLSAAAGISAPMLRSLNPVLIRGVTPPGAAWEVRVPTGTGEGVLAALAPRKPLAVTTNGATRRAAGQGDIHIVRPRETVSSIARLYRVSVGDIVRWNGLGHHDWIHPGDRLRVTGLRVSVEPEGQGGFR